MNLYTDCMIGKLFDAHFHIINPDFPLVENQGFLPEPFLIEDYLAQARPLGIDGGAVVSGSFQAFDQEYLIDALDKLGPHFVGVTNLPATVSDADIIRLHEHNIRALRFNLFRLGDVDADLLVAFARRVHELVGWHVELYANAGRLDGLADVIAALPAVSIDHLGLSADGLPVLERLVKEGVRVKATGFGRVDFSIEDALRSLYEAAPAALMFGTDLPSTRAPRPFAPADIDLIESVLDAEGVERVLRRNAEQFYRIK